MVVALLHVMTGHCNRSSSEGSSLAVEPSRAGVRSDSVVCSRNRRSDGPAAGVREAIRLAERLRLRQSLTTSLDSWRTFETALGMSAALNGG